MNEDEYAARIVLAALVDSMGGTAYIENAESILEDLKNNKIKNISLSIVKGTLRIEVLDEG